MATDPKLQAAAVLHRFGLGPRPGSIAAIASDPRGALLAELDRPGAGRIDDPSLLSAAAASRAVFEYNAERQAEQRRETARREAARQRSASSDGMGSGVEPKPETMAEPAPAPAAGRNAVPLPQRLFFQEARARLDAAVGAEIGLVERLVWFWSNHFCISADKVPAMSGGYEREAIRSHVLGRFADMLQAAVGHPAMLSYLDNAQSIGPNSVAGINRARGLNENLAREILELHTLGVRSVYTQDDVTSFAKVLTGWTILPTATDPERGAEFIFNKRLHEPGSQTIIGKVYPDTGVAQGRAVLADLARHPATARHIATKLARHFVADAPPPALVDRLARAFLDTDGDLKQVAKALVNAPEAWDAKLTKLKRPSEWVAALLRATGREPDARRVVQTQAMLGEPLWRPPAPKGFSDDNAAWMDGLAQRLDIANAFGRRVGDAINPVAVLETALGPLASTETRQMVARAESRPQALALLLMAPEFQRR